jgi:hypothetical protein
MERLITKGSFDVRVSRLRDEMSSPRILRIWLSRFVVAAMAAFSGLGKMRRDPKRSLFAEIHSRLPARKTEFSV